jgi:peptidoglycan/xylan/chitin deacetylase (PgdA/CDA1 family)
MKLVSPLLKHVVYPGLSKAGYLRRAAGIGPAVLTYHGVLPAGHRIVDPDLDGNLVSTDSFREQLRFVKDQYNVISPEEFLLWCKARHELPPRSVLLTCDDGLQSCLDMASILQEMKLFCLFFVTGASLLQTRAMLWHEELYLMFLAAPDTFTLQVLGQDSSVRGRQQKRGLWWNLVQKLSRFNMSERKTVIEDIRRQLHLSEGWQSKFLEESDSRRFLLLNAAEVRRLLASGMSIGAHTMSHLWLPQCSTELAWHEISESKRAIERELNQEVWAMAYPFGSAGSVTSREMMLAKRAGFSCAFLNVEGTATAADEFALPRVHVTRDMNLGELEAHISGFHRALKEALTGVNQHAGIGAN